MDCARIAFIFSVIYLMIIYAFAQRAMVEDTTFFYDTPTTRTPNRNYAGEAVQTSTMRGARNTEAEPIEPNKPTESSISRGGGSGMNTPANTGSKSVGQTTKSTAAPPSSMVNSGTPQTNTGSQKETMDSGKPVGQSTKSTAAHDSSMVNSGTTESGGSSSTNQSESILKRIEDFLTNISRYIGHEGEEVASYLSNATNISSINDLGRRFNDLLAFIIELPIHIPQEMLREAQNAVSYLGNATNTTSISDIEGRIQDFLIFLVELPIEIPKSIFHGGQYGVSFVGNATNTTSLDALGRRLRVLLKTIVSIEGYIHLGGKIAVLPALIVRDIFNLVSNLALLPAKLPLQLPILIPRYIYNAVTYVLELPLRTPGLAFSGLTFLTKLPLFISPGTYKNIESVISSILSNLTSVVDDGSTTQGYGSTTQGY